MEGWSWNSGGKLEPRGRCRHSEQPSFGGLGHLGSLLVNTAITDKLVPQPVHRYHQKASSASVPSTVAVRIQGRPSE